jgi:membrane protein
VNRRRRRFSLSRLWSLSKAVAGEFFNDSIMTVAGGITFFTLLAIFPAIGATVTLISLTAGRVELNHDLNLISGFLPDGAVTILRAEFRRLGAQKLGTFNTAFFISLALALWSASGGYKALVEGLNVAFEVRETRSFLRQSWNALVFTACGIVFAAVGVGIGLLLPEAGDGKSVLQDVLAVLFWPILFLGAALIFAVIYRFGPDRPNPRWRWITWGSAIASLLWLAGTRLFTWYVGHFGTYNQVYGDLGAAVGFLTWVWLSMVIVLLGAEINCELERKAPG